MDLDLVNSMNNKTTMICDLIISNDLDLLIVTESWLRGGLYDDPIIADVVATLPDFHVVHEHRQSRGGSICIIYRSSLKIT